MVRNIFLFLKDPSEIQILIKVQDIDDNLPVFDNSNITIGVRLNVPIDTSLLKIEATDIDADAKPLIYEIINSTFKPQVDVGESVNASNVFRLNPNSGELRTARSLVHFVDGMFRLHIRANNSDVAQRDSNMTVQVRYVYLLLKRRFKYIFLDLHRT